MTRGIVLAALGLLFTTQASTAADKAAVTWHPANPRVGDVAWILVKDVDDTATVEGSVDGKPLMFFPYGGGYAALFGVDLQTKPGTHAWRVLRKLSAAAYPRLKVLWADHKYHNKELRQWTVQQAVGYVIEVVSRPIGAPTSRCSWIRTS